MSSATASRTRFYLDKRHGKVMGVCAGIADYTGLDVTLVRIVLVAAIVLGGGRDHPVYFIAGWIADDKPRELADETRTSAILAGRARLAEPERARHPQPDARDRPAAGRHRQYVTTENRSLAREIEELALSATERGIDGSWTSCKSFRACSR